MLFPQQALYGFCNLKWERGPSVAEATVVSRYLPWARGSRVAEATIVSRHLQFEFEVATMMIPYYWLCYIYMNCGR